VTAAVLVVLAAESTFVTAAIQWTIVVVAIVVAVNRTVAVTATLAALITGSPERSRAVGGFATSAPERDDPSPGPG
jgi:hypothetical protein